MGTYLELIGRLAALRPPLYVFGGVAEDAVLDATLSLPHADLDVLVQRDELAERLLQAESLGFGSIAPHYEPLPGRPLVLGGSADGLDLELGVVDRDAVGFYFVTGSPDGRLRRVDVTDDLFDHPPLEIDGTTVHVVSPLGLYQMRDAFIRLGTFGSPRDRDVTRQSRLRELLGDVEEEELAPRVTPLA